MARLYPPNIAGTLPSFYGSSITIPYTMNKTVSSSEVAGFALRVKSASTETFLFEVWGPQDVPATFDDTKIVFELTGNELNKLTVGEYYKVQIAYLNTLSTVGYYSTVGIIKYTGAPKLAIANFDSQAPNPAQQVIVGTYTNEEDPTERAYEYKFTLYAGDKITILDTTGWKSHAASSNIERVQDIDEVSKVFSLEQTDQYILKQVLSTNSVYYIQYEVRTNNDLYCHSPMYELVENTTMASTLNAELIAELDYDNACVILTLLPLVDLSEAVIVGTFEIGRAEELENFMVWTTISRFSLNGHLPEGGRIFTDFTVEQGCHYKYAIRQLNSYNIYSSWIPLSRWRMKSSDTSVTYPVIMENQYYENSGKLSPDRFGTFGTPQDLTWYKTDIVTVAFEDAFLYDGKKQLRIRFDPKVSSFKTVISDSKKTALGSKYPYFFRNGTVAYKEFPINGLISYLSDQDEYFVQRTKDLGMPLGAAESTDITDDNIAYERRFKLAVLNWLNEDNIKLFKSPGEGNYLVRLSGVSLTPNDTTSRMIHSFACTADEIAEFSTEALIDSNFLTIDVQENLQTLFMTVTLDKESVPYLLNVNDKSMTNDLLEGYRCNYIKFEDCLPYTHFTLGGIQCIIGMTGQYEVYFTDPVGTLLLKAEDIQRNWDAGLTPMITYGIQSKGFTSFDIVQALSARKFTYVRREGGSTTGNLFEPYIDLKHTIEKIYYFKFTAKELIDSDISFAALQSYVNKANRILLSDGHAEAPIAIDANAIYRVLATSDVISYFQLTNVAPGSQYVYISINADEGYNLTCSLDYSTDVIYGKYLSGYNFMNQPIWKDNIINIGERQYYNVDITETFPVDENGDPYVVIGNGVIAEFGFYQKLITYDMEVNPHKISADNKLRFNAAKAEYDAAVELWEGTASENYKDGAGYIYFEKPEDWTDSKGLTRQTRYTRWRQARYNYLGPTGLLTQELANREREATAG